LDLGVKYEKPQKIKRQLSTFYDIFLTIYDYWNQTAQVYLRQNYSDKYSLTVGRRNCASSDKPDLSLFDLSDLNSPIFAIEIKRTDAENAPNTAKSNCAKKV
jgi:hypothetical protein